MEPWNSVLFLISDFYTVNISNNCKLTESDLCQRVPEYSTKCILVPCGDLRRFISVWQASDAEGRGGISYAITDHVISRLVYFSSSHTMMGSPFYINTRF